MSAVCIARDQSRDVSWPEQETGAETSAVRIARDQIRNISCLSVCIARGQSRNLSYLHSKGPEQMSAVCIARDQRDGGAGQEHSLSKAKFSTIERGYTMDE